MPTPGSGAISMNDMRTNINRATSSSISMSEMRTRYGGSGAISFSDLRNAEGFTIDPVRYYADGKISQNTDGWADGITNYGTISPDESAGRIQFAANSYLFSVVQDNLYGPAGTTSLSLAEDNTVILANNDAITAGFRSTNISRVVLANTSQSITEANASFSYVSVSYDMPTSGTIHCLVKF